MTPINLETFGKDVTLDDYLPPRVANGLLSEEALAQLPGYRTDLLCVECESPFVLKDGKYGLFYGCTKFNETGCRGSQAADRQGNAVGLAVTGETKDARRAAFAALARLYEKETVQPSPTNTAWDVYFTVHVGTMTRPQAYEWMTKTLKLKTGTSLKDMDAKDCRRVVSAVERLLAGPRSRFARITDSDDE